MLTNREFHLQTGNLAYKTGFSFTKRESWVTKGILGLLFTEKLPSVREFAAKYAINPNTIARAYKELEQEGYLYSKSGLGTYVSATDKATQLRADELIHEFDDIVMELVYLATPPDILKSRIDKIGERGNK